MYRKILISFVTMIITVIAGATGFKEIKNDNSVEVGSVVNETQEENAVDNTLEEEVVEEIDEAEDANEEIKEDEIKNEETTKGDIVTGTEGTKGNEPKNTKGNSSGNTKDQGSNATVGNTPITCNSNQNTQGITNKQEVPKTEEAKPEYIYNYTETQKLITDIDEIAKSNPNLWGKNGEKKYSVEVEKSLVGQNYMSPYSYGQVQGKVLNVFSVKFLVCAFDYKRPGFATETRYYIDIAQFETKK